MYSLDVMISYDNQSLKFTFFFFFSSRRRHTRSLCDWSSDVCSSDLRDRGGSTIVGTFGYMAPEQLHGQATAATDLYALGATRSEERRVGKECRSRGWPYHEKKKE